MPLGEETAVHVDRDFAFLVGLFVTNQLFTLSEMRRSDAMLKAVYRKAGASGNYRASFYPGLHKFDRPMQEEAFAWFSRWLAREK